MLKFTSPGEVYNPIISDPAGYRHLNTSVSLDSLEDEDAMVDEKRAAPFRDRWVKGDQA